MSRFGLGLTALCAVALALASHGRAQSSGGPYSLPRASIDGGGRASNGGSYRLYGVVGQADSGAEPLLIGGDFALRGGLLAVSASTVVPTDAIFDDGFED